MDVEKRKERIREELKSCQHGLTTSDRRLIAVFLGYLPINGVREKKKDWEVSPIYVRSNIFPFLSKKKENEEENNDENKVEIEAETRPFDLSEIDFHEDKYFSSIFKRDKETATNFLANEGIQFSSIEECSLVRTFQVCNLKKKEEKQTKTCTDRQIDRQTETYRWIDR